jgi:hypothetical protein
MKRKGPFYLLLLLLMWGWVDDLAVSAANSDPGEDVFTSVDDEYLSSAKTLACHKELWDCAAVPQVCYFIDAAPAHAILEGFSARKHTTLSAVDPLYAFMSQQC